MNRYLQDIPPEIDIYIHLHRPDLLPFAEYRDFKKLKAQLTTNVENPGFEVCWQSIQTYFSKRQAKTLWDQINAGQYARPECLPPVFQRIFDDAGCVYVKRVKCDQYPIGHRSNRNQLSPANIVEVIPAQKPAPLGQELRKIFSAYKARGTQKQFTLNKSQIAEMKAFSKNRQYRFAANILHNLPSIRCVLLSRNLEPNSLDLGLHMLPSQIDSRPAQRSLTL